MRSADIARFLNKLLNVKKIPDSSRNGLQVGSSKKIRKVGFAVDASLSTFKKAKKLGVDLLIVHHGLKWRGARDSTGIVREKIEYLKKNKMDLYACHLPLDMHERYGNNIVLANILKLNDIKKFGKYHGISIGFQGRFKKALTIKQIAKILDTKLNTKCTALNFGKSKIRTVAIVSGGGASALPEAYQRNIDCFISGEAPHNIYIDAEDLGQNIILGGHYDTETVGVGALRPLIKQKFAIKAVFIHNRTLF